MVGKLCPAFDTFSITPSAQLYSTLGGVLAGFAFFTLIFILPNVNRQWVREKDSKGELQSVTSHILLSLIVAFLCLVVTTFLYAVLASELQPALAGGRAQSEEMLDGVAVGTAVIALLYPIVLLVAMSGLPATGRRLRVLVSIAAPTFAMLFVSLAAADVAMVKLRATGFNGICKDSAFQHDIGHVTLIFPLGIFLVGVLIWLIPSDWFKSAKELGALARGLLPWVSLAIVVVAALTSAYWSNKGPTSRLTNDQVWVCLYALAAVLVVQQIVFRLVGGGLKEAATDESTDNNVNASIQAVGAQLQAVSNQLRVDITSLVQMSPASRDADDRRSKWSSQQDLRTRIKSWFSGAAPVRPPAEGTSDRLDATDLGDRDV